MKTRFAMMRFAIPLLVVFIAVAMVEFLLWGRIYIIGDTDVTDTWYLLFFFAVIVCVYVLHAVAARRAGQKSVFSVRLVCVLVLAPPCFGWYCQYLVAKYWDGNRLVCEHLHVHATVS